MEEWLQLGDWYDESEYDGAVRVGPKDEAYGIVFKGHVYWLRHDSSLRHALDAFNNDKLHLMLPDIDEAAMRKESYPRQFKVDISGLVSGDPNWTYKGLTTYVKPTFTAPLTSGLSVEEYVSVLPQFGDF